MTITSPGVSLPAVFDSIAEIAPLLEEQRAIAAEQGALTSRAIDAVIATGLIGGTVPVEFGGLGLPEVEWLRAIEELSRINSAAGWCSMTVGSHAGIFASYMTEAARQSLFADGIPRIAGAPAPRGRARVVDGGVLFSGKHQFASGSAMATHFVAGGLIVDEGGEVVLTDARTPEAVMVIVERDRVDEQGNWDVVGMRATSSIDYEVGPDLFVPDELVVRSNPRPDQPHTTDYWRIGLEVTGAVGHAPCALGMAHRALQEVSAIAPTRQRIDAAFPTLADQPTFQRDLAVLDSRLYAARAALYSAVEFAEAEARALRRPVSDGTAHRVKQQVRLVHDVAMDCAAFAFQNAGSKGFRNGHIVAQLVNDLQTISTHVSVDPHLLTLAGASAVAGLALRRPASELTL